MKYRRKPVVFDAVPVTWDKRHELCELLGKRIGETDPLRHDGLRPASFTLPIGTPEGSVWWDASRPVRWWIIKGPLGGLSPCRADIFEATFEKVDEDVLIGKAAADVGYDVEPLPGAKEDS